MAITQPAVPATGVNVPNTSGQTAVVTTAGGTVQGLLSLPPVPPVFATPPIPATTVQQVNNNAFPVAVAIAGGTVTVVAVNGATQFTATGVTVVVPAGGNIALTYSVVPTSWTWTGLFAGFSGNPVGNASIAVLPGGSLTPIFSGAPTWTWTNPLNESGESFVAAENTSGVSGLAAEASNLPLYSRQMGGEAGLGAMEDN
jgi:hypothetical protein